MRAQPKLMFGLIMLIILITTTVASAENVAPTNVTITADETVVKIGEVVSLSGSAFDQDNDPLIYRWSFGDGATAIGQNVKHVYDESGEFLVTLTVDDEHGHIVSATLTISISGESSSGNENFLFTYDVSHGMPWGLLIVMYIYFTGMSAGSFVLSSLGYVFGIEKYKPLARIGIVLATILLIVAPLFLILDLEQPLRAYTTLYRVNPTSVISWGVYLLALYPLNCIIYAWFLFRENIVRTMKKSSNSGIKKWFYHLLTLGRTSLSEESIARDMKRAKVFGIIGVPLAIAVHGYTGFLLAAIAAKDLWNTSLMPVLFLVSAIVSGIALFIIVVVVKDRFFTARKEINRELVFDLGRILTWMIVLDIMLIAFELIVLFFSGTEGSEALWLWLYGPFNVTFLGVEIIVGAIIPVAILLHPKTRRTLAGQITASILVLIGIVAMRYNVIIGGQTIPMSGFGFVEYSASLRDIMITLGIIVLGAILILLALKILPFGREESISHIDKGGRGGAIDNLSGSVKSQYETPGGTQPTNIEAITASIEGMSRREFLRKGALCSGAILASLALPTVSSLASADPSQSDNGGRRYVMVIDLRKCIGCHACTQACKTEFNIPAGVWRSWVMKIKKRRGLSEGHYFLPRLCNHCDNPPCVKVCPVQATYKDKDGYILQRYDKCIGCKYCIVACPYDARFVHPRMKVIDKCTFCVHRVENGREPACVVACPVGARIFGDLNDVDSEVSQLVAIQPTQVLKPELHTKPMVYYIAADQTIMRSGIAEFHKGPGNH